MARLDKYIEIVEVNCTGFKKRKTKKWNVVTIADGGVAGVIKWYGGWRKYAFYCLASNFYDWDLLRLIAEFCEEKTNEHYGKTL